MMKKLTALLLSLMMLVLPVMGSAASQTVVTFTPGDLSLFLGEYGSIYEDVLDALSLTVYKSENEGQVSVGLQGTDVLTAAMALDEAGTTYLQSNLLGENALAVAKNEWELLMDMLTELMVSTGAMSASEAAELKESLAQYTDGSSLNLASLSESFTAEDFAPVRDKVLEIFNREQPEAVSEQPADCDTAAAKVACSLTPVEIMDVLEPLFDCLKANDQIMAWLASLTGNTESTMAAQMDATLEELRAAAVGSEETLEVVYYLDAEGNVVRADVWTTGSNTAFKANYCRQTAEQGVQHQVSFTAMVDDHELMQISGEYLDAGEKCKVCGELKIQNYIIFDVEGTFDNKNIDFAMNVKEFENGVSEDVMTLNAAGSFEDERTNFEVKLAAVEDGEQVEFALKLEIPKKIGETRLSDTGKVELAVTTSGMTVTMGGDYTVAAQTTDSGMQYILDCDVKLSLLGMEIVPVSIHAVKENCDEQASIVSTDALHPATMSQTELEAWGTQVSQNAQLVMISVMQHLPASVLQLMMGE